MNSFYLTLNTHLEVESGLYYIASTRNSNRRSTSERDSPEKNKAQITAVMFVLTRSRHRMLTVSMLCVRLVLHTYCFEVTERGTLASETDGMVTHERLFLWTPER